MMLAGFFEEVWHGTKTSQEIKNLLDEAKLHMPIHLYLDARSVFAAIANPETKQPTEAQLLYEVKALHHHLMSGRIERLTWIDTLDMLVDALTKGKVGRRALLTAFASGCWLLTRPDHVVFCPKFRPQIRQIRVSPLGNVELRKI